MKKVILNNTEVSMDACAVYMDEEIREELHISQDWESEQEFLDAYCQKHYEKYGEEFEI